MLFDAIVHAPRLRPGARVNIAQVDQTEASRPRVLTVGAELRMRIGVCAPDRACGMIIDYTADPESVLLAVGDATWRLRRSKSGGVGTPGLLSDCWFVISASDENASPSDHSRALSATDEATKG